MGRSANAQAVEETDYLLLERRHFMPYLERNPTVMATILRLLCQRVRMATADLEDAVFLDLDRRLAKKLFLFISMAKIPRAGEGVILPITQSKLGAMLGVTRESINKQIGTWQKQGIVRSVRGRLRIIKPDAIGVLAAEDD